MATPRRFAADAFAAPALAEAKAGRTLAVCLPARDEAATVGTIVERLRREVVDDVALVDELVVVDDHSTDATARIAGDAGARVVDAASVAPEIGPGKGAALWRSLHETSSEFVLWVDADIEDFGTHFVTGLAGPLLTRDDVDFVKGTYARPVEDGRTGGRVTELLARPAIATLHPDLAPVSQPLSGEYGGRRSLLERLPFVRGYGVDLALLVDVVRAVGVGRVAEVDLGSRRHRNRPLSELGAQATEVLRAALARAGIDDGEQSVVLRRPGTEPLLIPHQELPPLVDTTTYRATA